MAFTFPLNPSPNQTTTTPLGQRYMYMSADEGWRSIGAAKSPSETVGVTIATTMFFVGNPAVVAFSTVAILPSAGVNPPFSFALASGALPTGLVINTAGGILSGTPTIGGENYSFTISVTDSTGYLVNTIVFNGRVSDLVSCEYLAVLGEVTVANIPGPTGPTGPKGEIYTVSSIAALRANMITEIPLIFVQNYYAGKNWGGGFFTPITTGADNGGTLIVDGTGTIWQRVLDSQAKISVLHFGAYPDVSGDSTPAFQAAANYSQLLASSGTYTGVEINVEAGEYLLTATISFLGRGYVSIVGAGKGRTVIARNAAYGDTFYFNNGGIQQNLTVRGITIFHDVTVGNSMSGGHIHAVAPLHMLIEDCNIQAGAYGVVIEGGVYVTIRDCHMQGDFVPGSEVRNTVTPLYLVATTNPGAVPIPTIFNIETSQFNSTGNSATLVASSAWTTDSASITFDSPVPAMVIPGMPVCDPDTFTHIGTVQSVSGSTVTLTTLCASAPTGAHLNVLFEDYGSKYTFVINCCEEIHFNGCTFNGGMYSQGYIQTIATNHPIIDVTFTSCFIDGGSTSAKGPYFGFWFDGSVGSAYITRIRILGCEFNGELAMPLNNNWGEAIRIDPTVKASGPPQALQGMTITGCMFQAYRDNGINIAGGNNILITGCQIFQNNQGNNSGCGIYLGANATKVNISGNIVGLAEAEGYSLTSISTQYAGLSIANGADRLTIVGNDFSQNHHSIIDNSTTTNKVISSNLI